MGLKGLGLVWAGGGLDCIFGLFGPTSIKLEVGSGGVFMKPAENSLVVCSMLAEVAVIEAAPPEAAEAAEAEDGGGGGGRLLLLPMLFLKTSWR